MHKSGRFEDAVKELGSLGKKFSGNGSLDKAISVYKHLQKLSPADAAASYTLAELNEKHGRTDTALSEYKRLHDVFEKNGDLPECRAVLEKMQHIAPRNLAVRVRRAETCVLLGAMDEAYTGFCKAAALAHDAGDGIAVAMLEQRIAQLFPEKSEAALEALAVQVESGNVAAAVGNLQSLLRGNPKNRRAWELLIKGYRRLQQHRHVRDAVQQYVAHFPDDPAPVFNLISCAVEARDFTTACELLTRYGDILAAAGRLDELEQVYRSLVEFDSSNFQLLKSFSRIAQLNAAGHEAYVKPSYIESLSAVLHGYQQTYEPAVEKTAVYGKATDIIEFSGAQDKPLPLPDLPLERGGNSHGSYADWLAVINTMFNAAPESCRSVAIGNQMDASDSQAHFDMGQAFREMGLHKEAIDEFRKASHDASRRLECSIMQAVCLRERGDFEMAIHTLKALLNHGLGPEGSCTVKYELAASFQAGGDIESATKLLNEIRAVNPAFLDDSSESDDF
ncbi:MAG TPA: tetratricopeptide repeat protein [Desulfuromonadales bacterium]|nr:tetratricopeptide repeat protein [Desulfuromonadales bacterium]